MEIFPGIHDWQNEAIVYSINFYFLFLLFLFSFFIILSAWFIEMVFFLLFLFQSKEIAFQLQEDLMKVLNELYTVSSNICPVFI